MAYQYECDDCGESCAIEDIMYIERYKQNLCSVCINEVINSMENEDER